MRKTTLRSFVLTLAALSVMAAPALAAGPIREPFFPNEPFVINDSCDFPVLLEEIVNKEYGKTFLDTDGNPIRQIVSGRLTVRLTNVDEPNNSVVLKISGPAEYVFHEDGTLTVTLRGRSLVFDVGFLHLTTGHVEVEVTEQGEISSSTPATGTTEDVCAMLD